jgi:hypothetical protein
MIVVDMLDRILDSLSEALMHKMLSSRVRRQPSPGTYIAPPGT